LLAKPSFTTDCNLKVGLLAERSGQVGIWGRISDRSGKIAFNLNGCRIPIFFVEKRDRSILAVQQTWDRKMFDLIHELKRVRRLAEQVDDGMLLYLLDMAIVEARAKAGAGNDNLIAPDSVRATVPQGGLVNIRDRCKAVFGRRLP